MNAKRFFSSFVSSSLSQRVMIASVQTRQLTVCTVYILNVYYRTAYILKINRRKNSVGMLL